MERKESMCKKWGKRILALAMVFSMTFALASPAKAEGTKAVAEPTENIEQLAEEESEGQTVKFDADFAAVGVPLRVTVTGYSEGSVLSYAWTVGEQVIENTTDSYTPTEEDYEKWIQVTVSCDGYEDQTAKLYFSNLPVMYLNFDLDAVLADKTTYVDGTMKLQGDSKFMNSKQLYDGNLEVKGRGNTSWAARKKPFKLKLPSKADILGMGSNKHWVLLANATEGSLMRNDLAYKLSGLWGMTYQDGKWIDLIINGEYYGNYYLCEHIRVGKTRVNIADLADSASDAADAIAEAGAIIDEAGNPVDAGDLADAMEADLSWISTDSFTYNGQTVKVSDYYKYDKNTLITGGYLFELDEYYDEISKFRSSLNQPIMFNTPEFADTNREMVNYAVNFINSFESAIQSPDFHGLYKMQNVSAYDLFDFDSLVKYWMVQELFMNVDAMKKSTYLHKDQDTADGISKMNMGPVWDMDWSSNGEGGSDYAVWQTVKYKSNAQANQWYKYLCKDPYFLVKVREFYWAHRSEMKDMIASIYGQAVNDIFTDNAYEYLYESAMVNQKLWGNYKSGYDGEVKKLYTWLNNRMDWLDWQMKDIDTMIASMGLYQANDAIRLNMQGNALAIIAEGEKAEVLVNGKIVETVTLTDAAASIDLSANLTEGQDVIYVVVYDSKNQLMGTNYCLDEELDKGELIEMSIVNEPRNTMYQIGDELDLTGLMVNGVYSNGGSSLIPNSKLEITGFDSSTAGKKNITVKYAGFTDSFEITVLDASNREAGDWTNDYVTVYTNADPSGDKFMCLEVWEHGEGCLYWNYDEAVKYSGDFADIDFSFITKEGWKVVSVKYRDLDYEGGDITFNKTSGSFNFKGNTVNDDPEGNVLIIDVVPYEEAEEPQYVTLEESFTAEGCGELTMAEDKLGLDNQVGFVVYKNGTQAYTSKKSFTYEGLFKNLSFEYTVPSGFEFVKAEAVDAKGATLIQAAYTDGKFDFTAFRGKSADVAKVAIYLESEEDGNDFEMTCSKTTIKVNTNAVIYVTCSDLVQAEDITAFENGTTVQFSYTPTAVANDDGTCTWKLYLKPTKLGIHTYTIQVENISKNINIKAAKTVFSR